MYLLQLVIHALFEQSLSDCQSLKLGQNQFCGLALTNTYWLELESINWLTKFVSTLLSN